MNPYREPGRVPHLCVDCGNPCPLPALLCQRCIHLDALLRQLDGISAERVAHARTGFVTRLLALVALIKLLSLLLR